MYYIIHYVNFILTVCVCVCVCVRAYVSVSMCVYVHLHVCVCTCACLCVCVRYFYVMSKNIVAYIYLLPCRLSFALWVSSSPSRQIKSKQNNDVHTRLYCSCGDRLLQDNTKPRPAAVFNSSPSPMRDPWETFLLNDCTAAEARQNTQTEVYR